MSKLYKRALNKKSLKNLRLKIAEVKSLSELVDLLDKYDLWLKFVPINFVREGGKLNELLKGLIDENSFDTETSLYCYDPDDPIIPDLDMRGLLTSPVGRFSLISDKEEQAWKKSYLKWLKEKLKEMLD